jgi:hypothetical protein
MNSVHLFLREIPMAPRNRSAKIWVDRGRSHRQPVDDLGFVVAGIVGGPAFRQALDAAVMVRSTLSLTKNRATYFYEEYL